MPRQGFLFSPNSRFMTLLQVVVEFSSLNSYVELIQLIGHAKTFFIVIPHLIVQF